MKRDRDDVRTRVLVGSEAGEGGWLWEKLAGGSSLTIDQKRTNPLDIFSMRY
jgi:hypothetical protein